MKGYPFLRGVSLCYNLKDNSNEKLRPPTLPPSVNDEKMAHFALRTNPSMILSRRGKGVDCSYPLWEASLYGS